MFDKLKALFSHGILDKYMVERTVQKHSFYTVSAGRDRKTMHPVLLKVFTQEGAELEVKLDHLYRERPSAEVLPEIKSRYIVSTLEVGQCDGKRVEVLEFIAVPSLRDRMDKKQLATGDFKNLVTHVAYGLSYLHSLGFIHRGLAPEGIAVADGGDAKLTDLSLMMDAAKAAVSGTTIGPVGYVAPEVIARRGSDARSDVYSLGAVCYELLCGSHLFPNARGYEGLLRMMNTKPVPLTERGADVPTELEAVVMKAVERFPKDRFQTMDEMLAAFASAPAPRTLGNHPRTPAFAA
jgi:eukaryotic-like serine/threonine-protein kinase